MIRFFALVAPREGLTLQEFHDHWRHPHGTMGRLVPGLTSYAQAHRIRTELLDAETTEYLAAATTEYEGVAISGFDSPGEALALSDEPQFTDHVQPDEDLWCDRSRLRWLSTTEEVLQARAGVRDGAAYADAQWNYLDFPVSVQLLQFVRPEGRPDWAGEDDGALGRRVGALRHTRNRPDRTVHGDTPPFLGARQLWWPTLTDFTRGVQQDPGAFRELLARGGDNAVTLLARTERLLR
ncbi:EthD domain-containing protein [Streptomyces eurythermus]|uniref:EthD domain-containing protein n=1 Tax=Streptomyces eurythermus TaxID=42237 RepID=UPI0033F145E7